MIGMQNFHTLCKTMRATGRGRIRIILLITLLVGVFLTAGCGKSERPQPSASTENVEQDAAPQNQGKAPEDDAIEASFTKARIVWHDDKGNRVWEAQFKEAVASHTDDDSSVRLQGVEASLYQDGKVVSRLSAPQVDADSKTREVRASGGVKLVSAIHDASAQSERLVWKSQEHKVFGQGGVRMVKGNLSVTARSFESDTGLQKARFTDGKVDLD